MLSHEVRAAIHALSASLSEGSPAQRYASCANGARLLFKTQSAQLYLTHAFGLRLLASTDHCATRRFPLLQQLHVGLHRALPLTLQRSGQALCIVARTTSGALYLVLHRQAAFTPVDEAALTRFGRDVLPALGAHRMEVLDDVTPRQAEIIASFAAGHGEKEICAHLGISKHTYRTHVRSLYRRIGVQSRAELMAISSVREAFGSEPTARPTLTRRQTQVLERLNAGMSEKEAAASMGLSEHTVHSYIKQLHKVLGVHHRTELLARYGTRNNTGGFS